MKNFSSIIPVLVLVSGVLACRPLDEIESGEQVNGNSVANSGSTKAVPGPDGQLLKKSPGVSTGLSLAAAKVIQADGGGFYKPVDSTKAGGYSYQYYKDENTPTNFFGSGSGTNWSIGKADYSTEKKSYAFDNTRQLNLNYDGQEKMWGGFYKDANQAEGTRALAMFQGGNWSSGYVNKDNDVALANGIMDPSGKWSAGPMTAKSFSTGKLSDGGLTIGKPYANPIPATKNAYQSVLSSFGAMASSPTAGQTQAANTAAVAAGGVGAAVGGGAGSAASMVSMLFSGLGMLGGGQQ